MKNKILLTLGTLLGMPPWGIIGIFSSTRHALAGLVVQLIGLVIIVHLNNKI